MPVILQPIEDGHIIHVDISDPWKINEFIATFDEARAYLNAAKHPLHWLVNLAAATRDPVGVLRIREHPGFSHPRGGYVVFCSAVPLARQLTEVALRLIRFNRAKFFKTEAEALQFLREIIATETL